MSRWLRNLVVGPLAVALGALGVASASSASPAARSAVVGYSIVSNAYTALETAFQATAPPARTSSSTTPSAPRRTQAEDVAAGPARRRRQLLPDPGHATLVDHGRVVPRNWARTRRGQGRDGHRHRLRRRHRRASRATRSASRAGRASRNSGVQIVTPDPISSGSARWNLLAAYESQINLRQDGHRRRTTFTNSSCTTSSPSPERLEGAHAVPRGHGQRAPRLRERRARRPFATGKPIEIVYPAQNILIQTPAALTTRRAQEPGREGLLHLPVLPRGPEIWAHNASARRSPSMAAVEHVRPSTRPAAHDHRVARRVDGGDHKFFSPTRHHHEDRRGEWLYQLDAPTQRRKRRRPPGAGGAFASRALAVRVLAWPAAARSSSATSRSSSSSRSRPSSRTASRSRSTPTGPGAAFWHWHVSSRLRGRSGRPITAARAAAGDLALPLALARVAAINAVMGVAIAWVLVRDQLPRQAAVVEAVIDLPFALPDHRRGRRAALPLRHRQPDPRRPLRDLDGPHAGAALRDAALLGARRPAGPRVARRRERGRRAHARRRRACGRSSGGAARRSGPRCSAGSDWPSRARSASSDRSR